MTKQLLFASLLLVSCRQISGIREIVYEGGTTGGDGGGGVCTKGTAVLTSSEDLDDLSVAGGYAMAATLSSQSSAYANIVPCATNASCTNPPGLLTLAFSDAMPAYATSSSLVYYAVVSGGGPTGTLHSVTFDGKTDQVVLANASHPLFMGAFGTKLFWTSDDGGSTPASLHCMGCGTGDQTWITNLGLTWGVVADANNVYVIADDGSNNLTDGIYSCGTGAACGSSPKKLMTGLTFNAFHAASQIASDGTYVYVTNDQSAIIRLDSSAAQKTIVNNVSAAVIAVDGATGDLFYATDDGTVAKVKTDGSSTTPTTLSTCLPGDANAITGIGFDATNVYVLVIPTAGTDGIYSIPRN